MGITTERAAYWLAAGDSSYLFYPFGLQHAGYRVPREQRERIAGWTFWRAQMPIIIWSLSFVPVIDLWTPSFSAASRLEPETLAVALVFLTAMTWAIVWTVDHAIYAYLLKSCPIVDRWPTRSERHASSGQFGPSPNNLRFSPFPVCALCLATALLTISIGLAHGDDLILTSGALLSAYFACPVLKDSGLSVHQWLLYDPQSRLGSSLGDVIADKSNAMDGL